MTSVMVAFLLFLPLFLGSSGEHLDNLTLASRIFWICTSGFGFNIGDPVIQAKPDFDFPSVIKWMT